MIYPIPKPAHSSFLSLALYFEAEKETRRMTEVEMMQAKASQLSPAPSFNTYSSETLAEIAARVLEEFGTDPLSVSDDDTPNHQNQNDHADGEDDGDFEFALVCRDTDASPVSADDIFCNGQIKPMYPIFDRSFLFTHPHFAPKNDGAVASVSPNPTTKETAPARRHRLPLRKLMFEERETGSTCSSSTSDADDSDLDGVAPGTYCVWTPKSAAEGSLGRPCKKSTSTGSSSKRWKLRDLLLRGGSQSDRKEAVVFMSPSKMRSNKVAQEVSKPSAGAEHEGPYYMKNTGMDTAKEGDQTKRKSYLPYRQELVGLFNIVNGLGRNL